MSNQNTLPNMPKSTLNAAPDGNSRAPLYAFIAIAAAFFFYACTFVVDQSKYAVVFALGEIKTVIDQPGLHFKLPAPLQNVVTFERRILTIDTPDSERVQTSEKKNLQVMQNSKLKASRGRNGARSLISGLETGVREQLG